MEVSEVYLLARIAEEQTTESQLLIEQAYPHITKLLSEAFPVPVERRRLYLVVVPPGKRIIEHSHREWVALFYIAPTDTPVIIDGREHLPSVGEVLVIPPNTPHSVPENKTGQRRVSVALKAFEERN